MSPEIRELAREFEEELALRKPAVAEASIPVEAAGIPEAAPTPSVGPGCQILDFNAKGCHLDVRLDDPAKVVSAAELMDRHGFALDTITGVDWIAEDQMEVVYDYFHPETPCRVAVKVRVPRGTPAVPTISGVYAGANWHERETHEFFGIEFAGHPNLIPLLLPEDADFHPLRKDYNA